MHSSYEIRLLKADGKLSILMVTEAADDGDARKRAWKMLAADLSNANIWKDGRLVASIYRFH